MDIVTNLLEVYPLHTISEMQIQGKHLCYVLEDTLRPSGIKVKRWTALPRTGMSAYYKIGTRFSPSFDREMLSIYNQKDGVTINFGGVSFVYAMFHGGNTHLNTEGCPLVAYDLSKLRRVKMQYAEKEFSIEDKIIFNSAEADLFDMVSPLVKKDVEVRLFMNY